MIPGLLLALITAHLFIMTFQKHTQFPGKGRTNANVVGAPAQQAARSAEQRTGLTEEQWQRSVGPYISQVLAAGEHPMLARRVLEGEELDPDAEFAFGLDRVLDGLAARLGR